MMDNLAVMSVAYMLGASDAIIWRGPKKNQLIKQFLKDVDWGELDYLVTDTPPGTSDEHMSLAQYLRPVDGAIIVTTPQVRGCVLLGQLCVQLDVHVLQTFLFFSLPLRRWRCWTRARRLAFAKKCASRYWVWWRT